jgi:DNA-binding NtrC family response regulator
MTKSAIKTLIIDDDPYFRLGLKSILKDFGIVEEADCEHDAIRKLSTGYYDLAIIDMQIDEDESGLAILKKAKSFDVHSIIMSSVNDDRITELAYEFGCDHYLAKLHYKQNLETYVRKFIQNSRQNVLEDFLNSEYITSDSELIEQLTSISQIDLKNKSIFIAGETGVGKTQLGKLIHKLTHEEKAPFIHLNCSEIPENLIESELFGHKKGSFTGATTDKKGKLELAHGGTLFLDEIATMPKIMQQKLLKALDEHTFYPVGSNIPVKSHFTLITATCEDLFEKVHAGVFRKDLFFRISGLNLDIKPLRERVNDIEILVKHFIKKSPRRFVIKSQAMEILKGYSWPGNIRELKKTVELLSLKTTGIITPNELPDIILQNASLGSDSELLSNNQKEFIATNGLRSFIKELEKQVVKETMDKHQGKITKAIRELKISTSAFYRILDQAK